MVDISHPRAPLKIGTLDTPVGARDVFVSGHLAYVVGSGVLSIVNVSNPTIPVLVGRLKGVSGKVSVSGGLVYIAAGRGGLLIIDPGLAAAPAPTPPQVHPETVITFPDKDLEVSIRLALARLEGKGITTGGLAKLTELRVYH